MINTHKKLKEAGRELFKDLSEVTDVEEAIEHMTCSQLELSKKILRKKHIQGKTNEIIAEELHMARATFYRNLDNAYILVGLMMAKEYQNSVLSNS